MSEGRHERIIEKLKKLGEDLNKNVDALENPKMSIPLRTLSNAYFDKGERLIKLGEKKQTRTSAETPCSGL